jgi:long-chain acyl-CoA synthetase
VFGLIFSLLAPLYTGSHVGICGNMKLMFREMMRVKPTTVVAVPGMAEIMLTIAKSKGMAALGGNLKLLICGAAPVPARLHEEFIKYGVNVLAGYGMTETSNLVSGNLDMDPDHLTSVGPQYPEQEMRIVDGELQVKGDMLFDGYWKNQAATDAAFTEDGWLRTGDLARLDPDGFLYIVGRIKNLIILDNGENVSPEEVEAYFYRCDLIRDCLVSECVINGKPAIQLEILPADGVSDEDVLEAAKNISKELPSFMRPSKITLRHEDFEKSASLKIIRK